MVNDTHKAQTVDIREIPWQPGIDEKLRVSARGDLEIIKSQVNNGVAQLWHCLSETNEMLVVTRIDPGPELVIVLGEGSGLFEFAPSFLNIARKANIPVRTHIKRKGLIRMWSRLGLTIDEYVLRG